MWKTLPAILLLSVHCLGQAAPPAAPPDFDGDGKSDLVWTNADGSVSQWLMNGTTPSQKTTFGPFPGWSLFSADGDLNGDGKSDLVWTHVNGAVAVWLMNGATPIRQTVYGPYAGWTLLSANSDFDGDGTNDLLWINSNGQVALWLMDTSGNLASSATFGPYPGWTVLSGNNDFDGDGRSDLLWTHGSGAAAVWLMNGTAIGSQAGFGPYQGWRVVSGSADYNGDHRSDLLWRNTNGAVALWLMNGTTSSTQANFGPYAGWSVVPGKRDFNHDGNSDLLWTSLDGAAAVWLMNGVSPTSQVTSGPYAGWNAGGALSSGGMVSTLAGPSLLPVDGTGSAAGFNFPASAAVDGVGNVYVADASNHVIRRVSAAGVVTTIAGTGFPGAADGPGDAASFNGPIGVAIDAGGDLIVADAGNNEIRIIAPTGYVSTLAGSTSAGSTDGSRTNARFNHPLGVAVDTSYGNIYVADAGNNEIREIAAGGGVTTFAGSTTAGFGDGFGTAARFSYPAGIAFDGGTSLYVADEGNHAIRRLAAGNGTVTTVAGSGTCGDVDGTGAAASFCSPRGVAADSLGNVYVADTSYDIIRKITPSGVVTTLAGARTAGFANGRGAAAKFDYPMGIGINGSATLYVADALNNEIRRVSPEGEVSSLAGFVPYGSVDGSGAAARFMFPLRTAVDSAGNVYVSDANQIRKISPAGDVSTLAGSATAGSADGTGASASFNAPESLAVDAAGNLYVADTGNNEIRRISAVGVVTTLAGTTTPGSVDGTGAAARFNQPYGVAVDASGNVYVADSHNNEIRAVSPAGMVTTLAGSTTPGSADGTGPAASFSDPLGVAVDTAGNLYVADFGNLKIRKVTASGIVSTLAGTGAAGDIDGPGATASFSYAGAVAVDGVGNILVADAFSHKVRKVTPAGEVSTSAGSGEFGAFNGPAPQSTFSNPTGVAVDARGNVYVCDAPNALVRKITPVSP